VRALRRKGPRTMLLNSVSSLMSLPRRLVRLGNFLALSGALLGLASLAHGQGVTEFHVMDRMFRYVSQSREGWPLTAMSIVDPRGQQILDSWVFVYDHDTPLTALPAMAAYGEPPAPRAFALSPFWPPRIYLGGLTLRHGLYQLRSAHTYLAQQAIASATPITLRVQSAPSTLLVEARHSCFHFDAPQTTLQQFSVSPFAYPDELAPVGCGWPSIARQASANFFPADEAHGGIAVTMRCPPAANDDPSKLIAFDVVTPSLEFREDWLGLTGVELRFSASVEALVQAWLRVRKADGSIGLYPERAKDGRPVFHPTGTKTTHVVADYSKSGAPQGAKVLAVQLRVFVRHGLLARSQSTKLDALCPLPNRCRPRISLPPTSTGIPPM
jgi:hypothetical protein